MFSMQTPTWASCMGLGRQRRSMLGAACTATSACSSITSSSSLGGCSSSSSTWGPSAPERQRPQGQLLALTTAPLASISLGGAPAPISAAVSSEVSDLPLRSSLALYPAAADPKEADGLQVWLQEQLLKVPMLRSVIAPLARKGE